MRLATALVCVLSLAGPASAGEYRLRVVAKVGQPSPAGGAFDRFSAVPFPIIVPVNDRGEVAFFATLARAAAAEGLFLASGARLVKIAAEGDRIPTAGTITGFGRHPIPALNNRGTVAFHASLAGGRAVEGIFVRAPGGPPRPVALSGQAAADMKSGMVLGLEAPELNDRGQVAFLATVQRGRETIEAIYVSSEGRLRRIVAQGDPTPVGGTFAAFGPPSLNNRGIVGFPAVVDGGSVLGGLFLADSTGRTRKVVGAGEDSPALGYFTRFSDRLSLNDAGAVAFHALVANDASPGGIFVTAGEQTFLAAAIGAEATGGGRFASFGFWPALAADGRVAFVAGLEGGDVPVAVFLWGPAGLERAVAIGQASPAGAVASFGLYPHVSINRGHAIAFHVAPTAGMSGAEAILVAEPAP